MINGQRYDYCQPLHLTTIIGRITNKPEIQVYDTDGNFLQALDTIEMKSLLPHFLALVQAQAQAKAEIESGNHQPPLKLVDLGCGTGRNTLQLAKSAPKDARIMGLDASPSMLGVARETLREQLGIVDGDKVTLEIGRAHV